MRHPSSLALLTLSSLCLAPLQAGCSSEGGGKQKGESGATTKVENPLTNPSEGPPAGNQVEDASGNTDVLCAIPVEAGAEPSDTPDQVVGDGTPESCTSQAFVDAVAQGGVITFDCGDAPHTIQLEETAQIMNDASEEVVIDGGGLVTLSGQGNRRILYMNTCDQDLTWTTSHCNNQDHPRVTVQNLTFVDGRAGGSQKEEGGGAIWARGGRLKIVNSRFFNNHCEEEGPDVGGGAVRAFDQFDDLPLYVVNSTFGGSESLGNSGSNGGAISSIHVNWSIYNSLFSHNRALGNGANPAKSGTPGGGSGGAIYNDGNSLHLKICGSQISENTVNEHGSAIFFIANDHKGTLELSETTISSNHGGSWYELPGISMHGDTEQIIDEASVLEE